MFVAFVANRRLQGSSSIYKVCIGIFQRGRRALRDIIDKFGS